MLTRTLSDWSEKTNTTNIILATTIIIILFGIDGYS